MGNCSSARSVVPLQGPSPARDSPSSAVFRKSDVAHPPVTPSSRSAHHSSMVQSIGKERYHVDPQSPMMISSSRDMASSMRRRNDHPGFVPLLDDTMNDEIRRGVNSSLPHTLLNDSLDPHRILSPESEYSTHDDVLRELRVIGDQAGALGSNSDNQISETMFGALALRDAEILKLRKRMIELESELKEKEKALQRKTDDAIDSSIPTLPQLQRQLSLLSPSAAYVRHEGPHLSSSSLPSQGFSLTHAWKVSSSDSSMSRLHQHHTTGDTAPASLSEIPPVQAGNGTLSRPILRKNSSSRLVVLSSSSGGEAFSPPLPGIAESVPGKLHARDVAVQVDDSILAPLKRGSLRRLHSRGVESGGNSQSLVEDFDHDDDVQVRIHSFVPIGMSVSETLSKRTTDSVERDLKQEDFESDTQIHQSDDGNLSLVGVATKTTEQAIIGEHEGRRFVNEYVLTSELGRGAFGVVWLAFRRASTPSDVFAIKICSKSNLQKARNPTEEAMDIAREISICKQLDHPNIVKLLEVIDDPQEDDIYLVMEYLEKGPVMQLEEDLTSNDPPVLEFQAKSYMLDMLLGLKYMHENNVIHRDIKPDNLLVSKENRVKIGDFGISLVLESSDDRLERLNIGTPAFLAPESLSGSHNTESFYRGKPADIWAAGLTMYIMLFGHAPFKFAGEDRKRRTPFVLWNKIRTKDIKFPEGLVTDICIDVLKRMLNRDPEQRWTAADLLNHEWFVDVLPRDPFALASLLGAKVNRNVESQFAVIGETDELIYDDLPPTTWDVVRNRLAEKLSRKRSSYLSRRQRVHEAKSSHSSVKSFGIESIFDNLSEEGDLDDDGMHSKRSPRVPSIPTTAVHTNQNMFYGPISARISARGVLGVSPRLLDRNVDALYGNEGNPSPKSASPRTNFAAPSRSPRASISPMVNRSMSGVAHASDRGFPPRSPRSLRTSIEYIPSESQSSVRGFPLRSPRGFPPRSPRADSNSITSPSLKESHSQSSVNCPPFEKSKSETLPDRSQILLDPDTPM